MKAFQRSVGVSLDGTTLTVAWRSSRANGRWRAFRAPCDGTPESIRSAFAELGDNVPEDARVSVTLMRPLAHSRTVVLPRMLRTEAEVVLARDWMRFVIGHRVTAHAVAAHRVRTGEWRAVFAPSDTLDALAHMAQERRWRETIYLVSDDALAAVSATGGADACTVVVCDSHGATDGVVIAGAAPILGRRFLPGSDASDVAAFAHHGGRASPVVLTGAAAKATAMASILGGGGHRARVVDLGLDDDEHAGTTLAVAGASASPGLRLSTPLIRSEASRAMRGLTAALAVVAAVALFAAYGIERWGVSRQMGEVERERAALSSRVAQALGARAELDRDAEAISTMRSREALSARASSVLAAVALALPEGSAFTTFAAAGDSLVVEGESRRAAAVYEVLKNSPLLADVRLAAPVRRERQASADAMEAFAFSARVRPRSGAQ